MSKVLIALVVVFAALEVNYCLQSESLQPASDGKYFVTNPKSLDYKFQGKKGDHRYGVELKENGQFHHTKTEEDGVRLGCYGHMQDGKKYSTHYVADGKGYRLVSPKGLITVYPKDDGTPRKASFSTSFTQDEINTANIRYFFPDGCELGLAVDNVPVTPRIQKKDDVIEIPETTTEPIVEEKCVQPEYIQCCDDAQARIVLSATKNGTSKIVLPFDTELLNSCSVSEIVEITSEQNNIELLKKLLKFAQRHKL